MEEKIKLNQAGYEDYLKEIEKKEKELAELRIYKGADAIYQGDTWHDNPTLYQAELKEMALMRDISQMKQKLNCIEIVESLGDARLVDIGDIVKVDMIYEEDDIEEEIFKLIATTPDLNHENQIQDVSINSPLGKSLHHRKVGDTVSYQVKEHSYQVRIKEKVELN